MGAAIFYVQPKAGKLLRLSRHNTKV
jgi:hypothetical protein